MQTRTTLLSAAAFGFALVVGSARAADLPKEGTFTGTYSAAGTFKSTPLGDERWFASYEDYGLSVGSGLWDHTTWHCWAVGDGVKTISTYRGYCVGTDPTGDQIATDFVSDGKVDQSKPSTGTGTLTAGTGKYAGISGRFSFTNPGPEFKAPEGRYVVYNSYKGSYKLP